MARKKRPLTTELGLRTDDPGTRDNPLCVCPFCGGELQFTVRLWYSFTDTGEARLPELDGGRSYSLYCENDCRQWKDWKDCEADGEVPTQAELQEILREIANG